MLDFIKRNDLYIPLAIISLAVVSVVGLLLYYYWPWIVLIGGALLLLNGMSNMIQIFSFTPSPRYTNYSLRSDRKYVMRKGKVYRKR